jgi:uncharacterized protein YjiS (DUF1127 family)
MSTARFAASCGTLTAPAAIRPAGQSAAFRWRDILAQFVELALAWLERARQRRQLQTLNDHMLKDLGLSRADVEGEVSKPFWRP